jgi:phospho-N-acetylmuramoyl-pentapeptide-transferase
MICKLEALHKQVIRTDGLNPPEEAGTPLWGLLIPVGHNPDLLWADLANIYVWLALFIIAGFGLIGFVDDYRKIVKKNTKGLTPRQKLLLQAFLGMLVGLFLVNVPGFSTELTVPFFKNIHPDLGWFYVPFVMLVIVGASNAVNLTDGLDGCHRPGYLTPELSCCLPISLVASLPSYP